MLLTLRVDYCCNCFCHSQIDGLNSLHSVKASANRFTKTSQGRSWNTGNGSPDAICFSVDKPGIVVVGFSVYGGGGIHEYELEVLVDDVSTTLTVFMLLCKLCVSMSYHSMIVQIFEGRSIIDRRF